MIPIPEDQSEAVFPVVFAHNDGQELNLLIKRSDNTQLILIDYEYCGWNPMAMDLANYMLECMFDNTAFPEDTGTRLYGSNCMTLPEIESMTTTYMTRYFEKYMKDDVKVRYDMDCAKFIKEEYQNLLKDIWACVKLLNFQGGMWSMSRLDLENCTDPDTWEFSFCECRLDMDDCVDKIKSASH